MATYIPGTEIVLPDNLLGPSAWSDQADNAFPVAKSQHTIDVVFDFYVSDAAAMPSSTTNWTVLRPRRPGKITAVQVWMVDTGTSGTANTVDVLKNGSTVLTGAVSMSHSDTDNTLKSGTLTTATGVDFTTDDRITVQGVKGTNDGVGIKVRILGYYTGA